MGTNRLGNVENYSMQKKHTTKVKELSRFLINFHHIIVGYKNDSFFSYTKREYKLSVQIHIFEGYSIVLMVIFQIRHLCLTQVKH